MHGSESVAFLSNGGAGILKRSGDSKLLLAQSVVVESRLLDLFDEQRVHGTFVLGWVANKFPSLVREIALRGHELASHGFHQVQPAISSRTANNRTLWDAPKPRVN